MASSPNWYAIYTRSRHEQQVATYLERLKLETYLPLKRAWSARKDRKATVEIPALPGYLFVRCELFAETRAHLKRSPGIVSIVESGGRPAVIPAPQIESLRIALANSFNPEGHPYLRAGDRVRVVRGDLVGVEGFLVRINETKQRLVIALDYVNQALSVEIDASCVEPAD